MGALLVLLAPQHSIAAGDSATRENVVVWYQPVRPDMDLSVFDGARIVVLNRLGSDEQQAAAAATVAATGAEPWRYFQPWAFPEGKSYQGINISEHMDWVSCDASGQRIDAKQVGSTRWFLADANERGMRAAMIDHMKSLRDAGYQGIFFDRGAVTFEQGSELTSTVSSCTDDPVVSGRTVADAYLEIMKQARSMGLGVMLNFNRPFAPGRLRDDVRDAADLFLDEYALTDADGAESEASEDRVIKLLKAADRDEALNLWAKAKLYHRPVAINTGDDFCGGEPGPQSAPCNRRGIWPELTSIKLDTAWDDKPTTLTCAANGCLLVRRYSGGLVLVNRASVRLTTGPIDIGHARCQYGRNVRTGLLLAGGACIRMVNRSLAPGAAEVITWSNLPGTDVVDPGHFDVDVLGMPIAGKPLKVRVTARNVAGAALTDFNGTVDLTTEDPATCIAGCGESARFVGGVLDTSVTLSEAGTTALKAVIHGGRFGIGPSSSSMTIDVLPGLVDHFTVERAGGDNIGTQTAGKMLSLRLTALDAYGNLVNRGPNAFSSKVTIAANRACLKGCGRSANFVAGVLTTSNIWLSQAGADSVISISWAGSRGSAAGESNAFVVQPGPRAKLVVAGDASETAGSGEQLAIKVTDRYGNIVTSYSGTRSLVFSGALPAGSRQPTVTNTSGVPIPFGRYTAITFTNGVSTAGGLAKLYRAGTVTIAAADKSANPLTTGRLSIRVAPGAARKLAIMVPAGLKVGTRRTVTATVRDAFGNLVPTGSYSVNFRRISGAGKVKGLPKTVASSGGTAVAQVTAVGEGTVELKLAAPGLKGGTASLTILPLASPSLSSPAGGQTLPTAIPTLAWQVVSGASGYELQVSTDRAFLADVQRFTTASTAHQVMSLDRGTTYWWRVRATAGAGRGRWSGARSFITPALDQVSLLSPAASAKVTLPVLLDWANVAGATGYRLQLCRDDACSTRVRAPKVVKSAYRLKAPLSAGIYHWRVRALATGVKGAWSEVSTLRR
jgi:hypothetical protein